MSLAVDVAMDGVRVPVSRERIIGLVRGVLRAEKVRDAMISVAFVDERAIAKLNKRHLGHTGYTDVISFGFAPSGPKAPVVGDIYICPGVARWNAALNRVQLREELRRLVIHGTLHVLGYDHPEGEERLASPMWRRQEQLLRRLAVPSSRTA